MIDCKSARLGDIVYDALTIFLKNKEKSLKMCFLKSEIAITILALSVS